MSSSSLATSVTVDGARNPIRTGMPHLDSRSTSPASPVRTSASFPTWALLSSDTLPRDTDTTPFSLRDLAILYAPFPVIPSSDATFPTVSRPVPTARTNLSSPAEYM